MSSAASVAQATRVRTERLTMNVLTDGREAGLPVVFVHGNVSSAVFWRQALDRLPDGYRGLAPDLRGFGHTDPAPVDATNGLGEYAADLAALNDLLDLDTVHLVGWSMGGGVVLRYLGDHPERVRSVTLVDPVSPYGFGGTKDLDGTATNDDFAGSGAGTVNPQFIARIAAGDQSASDEVSPRNVMNATYFKPPFRADDEDALVDSLLTTRTGIDHYPGDSIPSPNWPHTAPGTRGLVNAMSPRYIGLSRPLAVHPKPPILWIRGADDVIISDASVFELGNLGRLGVIPGWPGEDAYPPQPMVAQTRAWLDRYADVGGSYRERVMADTGHTPHVEKPDEFVHLLSAFLSAH